METTFNADNDDDRATSQEITTTPTNKVCTRQVDEFVRKLNKLIAENPNRAQGSWLGCSWDDYEYIASNVERRSAEYWTTRILSKPETAFGKPWLDIDKISFPINRPVGDHWIMITLYPKLRTAVVSDSNSNEFLNFHKRIMRNLLLLIKIYTGRDKADDWSIHMRTFRKLQGDSVSCGVYMCACMVVDAWFANSSSNFILSLDITDIANMRRLILEDGIAPLRIFNLVSPPERCRLDPLNADVALKDMSPEWIAEFRRLVRFL